ncbi:MAG: NupC/NupG family nucleoside CNT transporter [bacterium]|nr:NupC/NupG family nucleoside CNT transporter [bacterium]
MTEVGLRAVSAVGFVVLLGITVLCSTNRGAIDRRTVLVGVGLQVGIAVLLLATPIRDAMLPFFERLVSLLLAWSQAGAGFLFGALLEQGESFALGVLPLIIFMGSLFGVLYHLGLVQPLVRVSSRSLSRAMGVSGAEGLAAASNVFVGMIESGIVVGPYLARMTRSELFAFMTLGMSTIAGTVLVTYAKILGAAQYAGHLIVASLISAPAALVVAKIMIPETETPETAGGDAIAHEERAENVIDAAAVGALAGLRLALSIGALLIAFVALIALANSAMGAIGGLLGQPDLTLQALFGWLFAPVAALMGVPWAEAREVGALIGVKTVLNEFIAYHDLAAAVEAGRVGPRSALIASYALCGFANFGSLAILLGGLEALAPERRPEAARLGLRSILAGTIATCLTGCLAGLIA